MNLFWLLACIIYTVAAKPLEEEIHLNGENGWYLPLSDGSLKWVDMKTVEAVLYYYNAIEEMGDFEEEFELNPFENAEGSEVVEATTAVVPTEINDNRVNGVTGWYLPFADGSLKWMDMEIIEMVQKYQNDVINSISPAASDKNTAVTFWLYTALNPKRAKKISANTNEKSGFNPEHPTIFVGQSFLRNRIAVNFNTTLKNAFFKTGNYNFISIEWLDELDFDYISASAQVPLVGELAAKTFDLLATKYQMNCEKTHFIGYGLGAQIVGFAAKNIKSCKIPKITALDPTLALFPYDKPEKRLNSTDARCVQSIQTNGGYFGHVEPVGSAAFYCNGGKQQPGCGNNNVCSHERSVKIFEEAIIKNDFLTNKCENYKNYLNESCNKKERGLPSDINNDDLVYFVNDKSP